VGIKLNLIPTWINGLGKWVPIVNHILMVCLQI